MRRKTQGRCGLQGRNRLERWETDDVSEGVLAADVVLGQRSELESIEENIGALEASLLSLGEHPDDEQQLAPEAVAVARAWASPAWASVSIIEPVANHRRKAAWPGGIDCLRMA